MSDKWKYVSVGKCISAIIWSAIGFCLFFIPFAFNNGSFTTLSTTPIFGNSIFFEFSKLSTIGLATSLGISGSINDIISMVLQYSLYAYMFIPIATAFFALVLAIFRAKALRVLFKIFSILFGIALIVVGISFIVYIVGIVMYSMQANPDGLSKLTDIFLNNGIIFSLVAAILSFIMARKQFGWFSKPF